MGDAYLGEGDLATVYGKDDLEAIWASFRKRGDLDDAAESTIKEKFERVAWIYKVGIREGRAKPKKLQRDGERIGNAIRKSRAELASVTKDYEPSIRWNCAARDLARRGRAPPHAGPEIDVFDTADDCVLRVHWPVGQETLILREALEWACLVADEVEQQLASEMRPAAPRADEQLREVVLSVWEIYNTAAANPKSPDGRRDPGSDEFLNLLQACLRPLKVERSDEVLRRSFLRARAGT